MGYYVPSAQQIQEVIYSTFTALFNIIQPFLPYIILFIIFLIILRIFA